MSIISYLAITKKGQKDILKQKLKLLKYCEYIEPESKTDELLIVVTETPSVEQDESIFLKLSELEEIQSLTMTYGHSLQQQDMEQGEF